MLCLIATAVALPTVPAEGEEPKPKSADWRVEKLPLGVIDPKRLQYVGAFTLPAEGRSYDSFGYAPGSMTYCPTGDGDGPGDGHPGSLFVAGHASGRRVAEVDIPAPTVSEAKDPAELKVAKLLQPFASVTAGTTNLAGKEFGNPIYALGLLPRQGGQKSDKLYFGGWRAYTPIKEQSRGWCSAKLSEARPAGMWVLEGHGAFSANSAIMEIPTVWADKHCGGLILAWAGGINGTPGYATGRGPAIIATAPWRQGDPPAAGAAIKCVTLLKYGSKPETAIRDCQDADGWHGAAWVSSGTDSAVVFFGVKDLGESWYGYPKDEKGEKVFDRKNRKEGESRFVNAKGEPVEKVSGNRGWKSDRPRACLTFYDPAELAAVAAGTKKPHEPQPYARVDVSGHVFIPTSGLSGCGYDRRNGILYSLELSAGVKSRGHNVRVPLVHVWKVLPAVAPDGK